MRNGWDGTRCPLCSESSPPVEVGVEPRRDASSVGCPSCGEFGISRHAIPDIDALSDTSRGDISCWIVERRSRGLPRPFIFSNQWQKSPQDEDCFRVDAIMAEVATSSTVDRLDRALQVIARNSPSLGATVPVSAERRFSFQCRTVQELAFVLRTMHERGQIFGYQSTLPGNVGLAAPGWERIEKLGETRAQSKQAFVAMSFNPRLESAWKEGIVPGISEAGYLPVRVDKSEHNEKICDRIISEIRRSRFLVADATRQRQGVYFEAGFALGLGIPVVWTCRDTDLGRCHFDTRQYNHIVWTKPDELRVRLKLRIDATIPSGRNPVR